MARKSLLVEVEPRVFKWLRESAGWPVKDVAARLKTTEETIFRFERGEKQPSMHQLKSLAKAFKRPVAAFLLSEPKQEAPLPKDYRMLPQKEDVFDKKTILAIRKTRTLQEVSRELLANVNNTVEPRLAKYKLTSNPSEVASTFRIEFGLTAEKQKKLKNAYELFNLIRDQFEDLNVIVFQHAMPLEDARGFALVDRKPNVIVVNTKDSIEARLFSLMHEFGHVLLGESAIDLADVSTSSRNATERWCDRFASDFLLPDGVAKQAFKEKRETLISPPTLNTLSRKFKVSKAVLLIKMKSSGFISNNEMKDVLSRYRPSDKLKKKAPGKQSGGVPADRRCLLEKGSKFVSLVANNYDKNNITYTDALSYLSIKSRNFDRVLAKARK